MLFSLGVLLGLIWIGFTEQSDRQGQRSGSTDRRLDRTNAAISALVGGLLGARLVFVGLHQPYYSQNPTEIIALWQGGLSATGGVLGAIMGVIVYGRGRMRPTWELLDELALPGLIVTVTAWIGCWLDGVAYGIQVPQNWGWLMDSDPFIDPIARWPTQMVGALLTLLAFLALLRISPGLARGATAGLMLFAIALTLLLVGLFRADPSMLLFQLRLDILGPAALTLVGIMITIHHSIRGRRSRS